MLRDPEASAAAHLLPECRVIEQPCDGGGEGCGIAGRDKQTGDAGLNGIAGTGGGGGDDGQRGGRGFQSNIGEAFAVGGQDEDVHGAIERGNLGAEAGNNDGRMGADALHECGREMVFGGIEPAAEKQSELRVLLAESVEGLEQLGDALVAGETTDVAENKSIGGDAAGGAYRVRTGSELVEIDAVSAAVGEHLQVGGGSDAEPGGLLEQAGTVAEDNVCAGSGESLGEEQQRTQQRGCGFDAQAAQGVDADRDAQQARGEQSEQSGLGRAEVHHGGAKPRKQAKDAQEGKQIVQRGDAATDGHGMDSDGGAAAQLGRERTGGAEQGDGKAGPLQGEQLGTKDEQGLIAGDAEEDGDFGCRGGHGAILTALRMLDGFADGEWRGRDVFLLGSFL